MENITSRKVIAELAGVSKTTVTRVLSGTGSVNEVTRKKVMDLVDKLGYTQNKIAIKLSKNENSNVVAMMVPDMTNYYYLEMFNLMVKNLETHDYTISVYKVNYVNFNNVLTKILENRVAVIINLGFIPLTEDYIKKTKALNIKLIHPGVGRDNAYIKINYKQAMQQVFENLLECNSENFMFICGGNENFLADSRIADFIDLCDKHGIPRGKERVVLGNYPAVSSIMEGYSLTKKILKKDKSVDVLFCLNDMMGLGAIKAVQELKLEVGKDVSIIGFDNILLGEFSVPKLTTIDSAIALEAKHYMDYILNSEVGEMQIHSNLILRDSTRKHKRTTY